MDEKKRMESARQRDANSKTLGENEPAQWGWLVGVARGGPFLDSPRPLYEYVWRCTGTEAKCATVPYKSTCCNVWYMAKKKVHALTQALPHRIASHRSHQVPVPNRRDQHVCETAMDGKHPCVLTGPLFCYYMCEYGVWSRLIPLTLDQIASCEYLYDLLGRCS